jgi:uncharacterized protein (TIGR02996 family)
VPENREDVFLAAVVAAPGDDGPRLAYADWLARRDARRAEFIRVQCAWDASTTADNGYWEFGTWEWGLRTDVDQGWRDRLDGAEVRSYRVEWERCLADPNCLTTAVGRRLARRSARNLMRRTARNIGVLAARLRASGYRFFDPDHVVVPTTTEPLDEIADFERATGYVLPASLTAFVREIGSVNLMGTHPDWAGAACFFDGEPNSSPHLVYRSSGCGSGRYLVRRPIRSV